MRPIDLAVLGCAALALHGASHLRRWRADRPGTWDRAFYFLCGAQLAGFLVLFLGFPVAFVRSVSEDQWVEWMTFHCFAAAAVVAMIGANRRWSEDRWGALAGALLALLCLLVAMEEISWGQRLLGFEAPASLRMQNSQGEANLHNLIMGPGTSSEGRIRKLAAVAILGYGVLLPWFFMVRRRGRLAERFPVATPGAMFIFLAAAVALIHPTRYRLDEIGEYLLGLGMAFVMVTYSCAKRQRHTGALLAAAWSFLFLLALAPAWLGWGAPQGRAWSRQILQYYFYSFAVERFPKNEMWQHSRRVLEYAANHGFENGQTHLLLAQIARGQQDDGAAATFLHLAKAASAERLRQEPDAPFALYAAALVHREAGQTAVADSLTRRGVAVATARLRHEPQNDVILTLLGRLQEDLGDSQAAAAAFSAVAKHDPSYRESFRYMLWTGGEEEALRRGFF